MSRAQAANQNASRRMAGHSSFARIKKSRARFGNRVMLLDHSATMVCNAQRERSRKRAV